MVWRDGRPTRAGVLFDLAGAGLFSAWGLAIGLMQAPSSMLAAGLLGIALAVRRRWVPLMVVLAVAAALVQVIDTEIAYAADVAYLPLFFTLGSSPRAGVRRLGLAAAALSVVVAGVYTALTLAFQAGSPVRPAGIVFATGSTAAMCAVFTLGGWLLGQQRWQRRQTLQARVDAALDARVSAVEQHRLAEAVRHEAERGRIAADMHDVVAHSWAVVAAQADGARYALRTHPDDAEQALRTIGETARTAMADVRRLLTQLRDRESEPTALDFERRGELLGRMRASGMTIVETSYGTPQEHRLLTVTAHRLLGEALTNALKHGELSRPVEVEEDWRHGYRLRVRNAIAPAPDPEGQVGHGLVGMAERAEIAGGSFASRILLSEAGGPQAWEIAAFIPAIDSSEEDA